MMEDLTINDLKPVLWFLLSVASYVGPFAFIYLIYLVLSLPMRRRESAQLFLDMLELGLEDGLPLDVAIVQATEQNDTVLGKKFNSSSAQVRAGMSLDEMLDQLRRFLPPPVVAMLAVGAELGEIRRVLPACRQTMHDALSQTRGAFNYLGVLSFVVLPVVPFITFVLSIFVVPKFQLVAADMGAGMSPISHAVFALSPGFVWVQILVWFFFMFLFLSFGNLPEKRARWARPMGDRVLWLLPWRRKRIQRDFATMLALLLDAGVPEQRAVLLAAESTGNLLFKKRAQRVAEQISSGVKLTEAVRALDDSGEFHWRLINAKHSSQGFITALRGWFESLDAKAFQQEQAAAQALTTALVLWNGLVIGLFVIGMFNVLTNIIEEGVLW
jgi:type II secretory pathway component PulF